MEQPEMKNSVITPALRRALMRAKPDYFQMSLAEQEAYRVAIPEDQEFIIEQQLFSDLLNVQIKNEDELNEAHKSLSFEQLNTFNEVLLPVRGIGDDYFWLNEHLGERSLLDFNTLYDYDSDDHEYQETARERDFKGYNRKSYRGSLYCTWSRLFVDGRFYYGILYCAAGYLYGKIDGYGSEVLYKLIPHEYVRGKNHGKKEDAGFLLDMKIDAGGMEEQYEELRHRFWQYQETRYDELQAWWDKEAHGTACQIPNSDSDDPEISFIFSDKTALQKIRFRHFMKDFRGIEIAPDLLVERVEFEKERLEEYLVQQFEDIEKNFDPKITKFRKKRKIIMTPQAVDDLGDLI